MAKAYAYYGNADILAVVAPRLAEAGYQRVENSGAAEVALTYCLTQADLEEAYFGDRGFVSEMAPGSLLIDLSAVAPSFARELGAVAMVSDLSMVEAPLVVADMVSPDAFAKENLSCFAAGEEDAVARAMDVLNAIFGRVHETGGLGTAQLARAAFSLQVAAQVIAAIEADALYRSFRRSVAGSGLGAGHPGAATPWAEAMMDAIAEGRFEGPYTVEMFMGELSAALMAADDAELILPQAEATMHLLELLAVIGGAEKSPAALSLIYGDEASCAEAGLDWTRAEQAYGSYEHGGCGCGHDHGHGHGYDCDCGHDHDDCDDDYGDGYDDFEYRGFGYN